MAPAQDAARYAASPLDGRARRVADELYGRGGRQTLPALGPMLWHGAPAPPSTWSRPGCVPARSSPATT